jgi:hypothetical protein
MNAPEIQPKKTPLVTIFTAPKAFTDRHINIIQRNAIQSWMHLGEEVQVLLVGEEDGLQETAAEFSLDCLTQVERNEWGTPLVSSIFQLAREASLAPVLAYVNADILLLPEFLNVVQLVSAQSQRYLVLGQRWDLDVTEPLDFSPGWAERLIERTHQHGDLHSPSGSDYFIFPTVLFKKMPDFAIGRAGWDNWMIYKALTGGLQVIDATPSMMIVHQNHDYTHLPGNVKTHYDLEETHINARLGGGMANMYITLDANRQLVNGRIRRPSPSLNRILRSMERTFRPQDDDPSKLGFKIARVIRRWRRKLSGTLDA